jgi:predicted DNA-binding transcriptional regulator AlpA
MTDTAVPPLTLAPSTTRLPQPRRGLSRVEAAAYIGISPSKFDELVADGRMPKPVPIDSRRVWDIRHLDLAFDALSSETSNSWEGV